MESSAIDVNDSNYSLDDYAKYGFQDMDPEEPVEIRSYLQTDLKLATEHDVGLFEEAQRFIRRRGFVGEDDSYADEAISALGKSKA